MGVGVAGLAEAVGLTEGKTAAAELGLDPETEASSAGVDDEPLPAIK